MRNLTNRGFIKTVILVIIALVLLKYFFNISLNDILGSQIAQDLWAITKSLLATLWGIVLMLVDFLKTLISNARQSVGQ